MENKTMNIQNFNDFHCHLDMKAFAENGEALVETFFQESSGYLITVADPYETESHVRTQQLVQAYDRAYTMTAAHPHNADQYCEAVEERILTFIPNEKVIAIGEAGLDFFYNLSEKDNQIRVFKRQIQIAKSHNLFLTVHSREAEALVLDILEREKFDLPVVFHCYTGNIENAKRIIDRGYYISFSGIITFRQKKTEYLREIVKMVPINQILSETDAPYLAPEPHRGKTNSPINVRHVAEKIAELKNLPVQESNAAIKENIERLIRQ